MKDEGDGGKFLTPSRRETGAVTLRALVVDDDPMALALCRLALRQLDEPVDVDVARDADAALAALAARAYDLVLADLVMPGASGADVLDAARRAQPDAMRVLMTSADDGAGLRDAIGRAQAHAFVPKPDAFDALRDELETLVQARRARAR